MSSEPRRIPSGRPVSGTIRAPSSKSVSHRALTLALLANRPIEVHRLLEAEDLDHYLRALSALGWQVDRDGDRGERVHRLRPPENPVDFARIDCGNAGTFYRFFTAVLTAIPGRFELDGTPRLRERPVGPLLDAIAPLGAKVTSAERHGYAPLTIEGGSLRGGRTVLDAGESSQYLSALMLAGLCAQEPIEIVVSALTSSPYVEITRRMIRQFVSGPDPIVEIDGGSGDRPTLRMVPPDSETFGLDQIEIDGDFSAAAYPAAAAALAATGNREVRILGLDPQSAQGDRRFLDLLGQMGARVSWADGELRVSAGSLQGIDADLSDIPDQVPTLAALAPFAHGVTHIRNVEHLRIKESDRLKAMSEGLERLGVPVTEQADGLTIHGCWAEGVGRGDDVTVDTYDDHRIAMSFALVGLRRPGVLVADPQVVAKSYPEYWRDLDSLLSDALLSVANGDEDLGDAERSIEE